jgi:hypothetical protein
LLASDTNDDAYDGHSVTGHYYTVAGVKKDFTAAYDTTDTTTEVACCTDFYCWNLDDYTAATVLVSSVAVQAGDDGKVVTLEYLTPWGAIKSADFTLAADTTTIVRLLDVTTNLVVLDFGYVRDLTTTAVVGKYVVVGWDADKMVGTVAMDVYYGVIEEGNYASVHSRYYAPGTAVRHAYLGDVQITNENGAKKCIVYVTYTPDSTGIAEVRKFECTGGSTHTIEIARKLEPLSAVTLTLADDAATPVNASVQMRYAEIEV